MKLKREYSRLYLKEDIGGGLDNETLLDLIVNAIFFDDDYLTSLFKTQFPTEDAIYQVFDQETITNRIMSDKELDKETAEATLNSYMDKVYGVQTNDII